MNIEKLNQYTEEQIAGLSNEDNQLRLIIKEQPNVTKLKLLKKAIVNEMTEVTLVISSNDNNLIDFSNFECINNNVIGVESYNYGQMLKSIRGISIFENLRKVVIEALYDNKLCINELALYLDTHPDDQKALCLHRKYCKQAKELKDKYQKIYGPLTINYPCNKWRWLEEPWPWERGNY